MNKEYSEVQRKLIGRSALAISWMTGFYAIQYIMQNLFPGKGMLVFFTRFFCVCISLILGVWYIVNYTVNFRKNGVRELVFLFIAVFAGLLCAGYMYFAYSFAADILHGTETYATSKYLVSLKDNTAVLWDKEGKVHHVKLRAKTAEYLLENPSEGKYAADRKYDAVIEYYPNTGILKSADIPHKGWYYAGHEDKSENRN